MDDDLPQEQREFYRARAPEYDDWWQRRGPYDRGEAETGEWRRQVAARSSRCRMAARLPRPGRQGRLGAREHRSTRARSRHAARGVGRSARQVDQRGSYGRHCGDPVRADPDQRCVRVGAGRVLRRALGLWEDRRVERWWVEIIGAAGDAYVSTFYGSFGNVHTSRVEIDGNLIRWLGERTRCDAHRWRHDSGCAPRVEPRRRGVARVDGTHAAQDRLTGS